MSYTVEEIAQLAMNGYCSNRLFGELTKSRSDYDACFTECDGRDRVCIAYNSLAVMPILEVTSRYNLLERKLLNGD